MRILIKNGTVINPETDFNEIADVAIEDGKVVYIGNRPDENVDRVIDARGLLVVPGLVDIHVHFRDPGFPQKETIPSGALSAAAGGFTSVVCMPNTKPCIDTVQTLEYVLRTGQEQAKVKVFSREDVEAVIAGLVDGTLGAIATDHAPHTLDEKGRPLAEAPFGMVGLETAVGLTFTFLIHPGRLALTEAIAKLTVNPSRIMGLSSGRLAVGNDADITILDPQKEWIVDPDTFQSKSRNSPFTGMKLKGKAVLTMVNGAVVYDEMPDHHKKSRIVQKNSGHE
jgi:dihydroorotase-like cyclic amidohydrolase